MKRKNILKMLSKHGVTFVEGRSHTKIYKDGCFPS